MQLSVISLGGSIVAPDNVDSSFLSAFLAGIRSYLAKTPIPSWFLFAEAVLLPVNIRRLSERL